MAKGIKNLLVALLIIIGIMLMWKGQRLEKESDTVEETQQAQQTLVTFFDFLVAGNYAQAVTLFHPIDANGTDNWESITQYSDPEQDDTREKQLKAYCEAVGTCLRVEVLTVKSAENDDYVFTVQFRQADGELYVFGPCCGATEADMPSQTQFDYTVKQIDEAYTVATPPLYRP